MGAVNSDRALLILARARTPDALLRVLLAAHPDPCVALDVARGGAGLPLTPGTREALRRPDAARIDADLAWLQQPGHALLGWRDPDYPALLRQCPSPPPLLFLAGDASLLWHPQVAIVGSRKPSAGGRDRARQFARALAARGWVITSGMAEGIDTSAHEGALATGRTIAVVGTGPDIAYPSTNAALRDRIVGEGLLVSEHPPGTEPLPSHFPSRNRILVGLALGTVVVEAALRSGALVSARLAAEAGREVFALPGSVDNPTSRGCHALIRQGAALVEAPDEVLATLGPVADSLATAVRNRLEIPSTESPVHSAGGQPEPDTDHNRLWSALGHDPTGMDALAERTGLTVAALSSMLLIMELEGRVIADHGRYARRS
ncbi:DNA-processing protein DprA [Arenimonas sp. MALMAid1274]|uniref:DNA-processing protein DprA n=1 Tax=Arenimonas sp. MALMAid1274 TaxID=3411630 RepID=UPI003BA3003E